MQFETTIKNHQNYTIFDNVYNKKIAESEKLKAGRNCINDVLLL